MVEGHVRGTSSGFESPGGHHLSMIIIGSIMLARRNIRWSELLCESAGSSEEERALSTPENIERVSAETRAVKEGEPRTTPSNDGDGHRREKGLREYTRKV